MNREDYKQATAYESEGQVEGKVGDSNESCTLLEPELIPADCGGGNKLGGAVLGPRNMGAGGTSDLRMLRRALRERWPLTDEMREKLPQWLVSIVGDEELDVRGRVGAAKVIVEMDKLNAEQERHDQTGGVQRIDVTSGGKPLGADLSQVPTEELERRLREAESRGLPGG